ncbi:Dot/Icm T4SS effector Wip [Candidatus Berkiella aquae]|uniref:Metallophosphoesterase n=1 Tax=Candidatus Berkiella aquae TaxID=295108 RepID=A0A0Q9YVC9_9GAMM|nr:Dot/Icm T4SS effector Wip [Candidatus Berkiella aquae]MCS5710207.1 metallophosphoesterase [Candidatus Berkiella aquae]
MNHEYITQSSVNITEYPLFDKQHWAVAGKQITLGDLHGNALKLLYTLTRHGFVDISKRDYQDFVNLYYKNESDFDDIQAFNALLNRIRVRTRAPQALLRLIGDVLADRGANDYFTLKLLKKLHDNGISVVNMISNHDAEFIRCYEKDKHFDKTPLREGQANSADNFQKLMNAGLIEAAELDELMKAYKSSLRVVDYSLNEARDKITIYSHGLIGLQNINYMAQALGIDEVTCDEHTSATEIAGVIDKINTKFKKYVQKDKITDLLQIKKARAGEGRHTMDAKAYPFAHLVWNREAEGLNRPEHINFVHGHDIHDKTAKNIYNLDNTLGKGPRSYIGTYNLLFTDENKLESRLIKSESEMIVPSTTPPTSSLRLGRIEPNEEEVSEPKIGLIERYEPKPIEPVKPLSESQSFDDELEREFNDWVIMPKEASSTDAAVNDFPVNHASGWFPGLSNFLWGSKHVDPAQTLEATSDAERPSLAVG